MTKNGHGEKTAQRTDGWCESVCLLSLSSRFRVGNLKLWRVGNPVYATSVHRSCLTSNKVKASMKTEPTSDFLREPGMVRSR